MKISIENVLTILVLLLAWSWFLHGAFNGQLEWEPAIAVFVTMAAIFAKDPIKEQLGLGSGSKVHDKALFEEFMVSLPIEPTIQFLRDHDFGNSFRQQYLAPLFEFSEVWSEVNKEFLDKKIERKRRALHTSAKNLAFAIARKTVPVRGGEFASVFPDSLRAEGERPQFVLDDAGELNELANAFVPLYEEFVRFCKIRLLA